MKDFQCPRIFCALKVLLLRAVPSVHTSLLMSCCGAGVFIMRGFGFTPPSPPHSSSPLPLFPSTLGGQCAMHPPKSNTLLTLELAEQQSPPQALAPTPPPPAPFHKDYPLHILPLIALTIDCIYSVLWQIPVICLTNVTLLRPHRAKSYADFYKCHSALSSPVCAPCVRTILHVSFFVMPPSSKAATSRGGLSHCSCSFHLASYSCSPCCTNPC